jgi:hypothetical protein
MALLLPGEIPQLVFAHPRLGRFSRPETRQLGPHESALSLAHGRIVSLLDDHRIREVAKVLEEGTGKVREFRAHVATAVDNSFAFGAN